MVYAVCGWRGLAISLADRFSAREIIGVLVFVPENRHIRNIDSFIPSCRGQVTTNSQDVDSARLDEIACSLLSGMDTKDLPDSGLDNTPGCGSMTELRIIMAIKYCFGISILTTVLEQLTTCQRLQDFLRPESGTARTVASGGRRYSNR